MVNVAQYPQLRMLLWNRPSVKRLADADAFALYEANWRHVDKEHMTEAERALVRRLTTEIGHGVLLV